MAKRLYLIAIAISALWTASAQDGRWVSNPDGILSSGTVARIDEMCRELEQKQLAQVAVLVLDNVPDDQLDLFAHRRLNELGVGEKGRDNGLVISVVRRQRDIQFETGYGLEGVLPDALCKRIQTVYMVGPLGAGNFDKGVLDGVTAVYNVLMDNTEELAPLHEAEAAEANQNRFIFRVIGFMVLIMVLFIVIGLVNHNKRNRGNGPGSSGTGSSGDGLGGRGCV